MLASILLASATAAPAPLPQETSVEVPQDRGPQDAIVLERVFPIGGASGWHTHPGYEIGHVVSGVTELRTAEGAARYRAGETFVVPRGVAHNGVNVGNVPVSLVITYIIDRDAPTRSNAPEPHAH